MAKDIQDAHNSLREAKERFQTSQTTTDTIAKDGQIRAAYCSMYRAADIASMLYTTIRRKGVIEDSQFLSWINTEFEIIVDEVNNKFYIKGAYSKTQTQQEFEQWFNRTRDFINKLDGQTKLELSVKRADEWMIRKRGAKPGTPERGAMIPSKPNHRR